MLTDAQRRALLLEMHRSIEQTAAQMASQLRLSEVPSLLYPPNHGFTEDEIAAIRDLKGSGSLESALRKIIASAASEPLYHLICVIDGICDPSELEELWLGARIEPVSMESEGAADIEPLRYDFYESYWVWRRKRPNPGWQLDALTDH